MVVNILGLVFENLQPYDRYYRSLHYNLRICCVDQWVLHLVNGQLVLWNLEECREYNLDQKKLLWQDAYENDVKNQELYRDNYCISRHSISNSNIFGGNSFNCDKKIENKRIPNT